MVASREHADARLEAARAWAARALAGEAAGVRLSILAGDASFRRYFRVLADDGRTWVLMDAPPDKEDVGSFLAVRDWLADAGVRAPGLIATDAGAGFLLLEDFGDVTWAAYLAAGGDARPLVDDAFAQLARMQASRPTFELPVFDVPRMRAECDLYLDWYLPKVAGRAPTEAERRGFHAALAPVLAELAALPRAPVHLDFHSRNLMLPPDGLPLGVIDFQDAVMGPVTYDAASLLYDCYQDYPEAARRGWSEAFFAGLPRDARAAFGDADGWHRALRRTALQRHIKAIGIFARLAHRDGKRRFLDEIPLTRKHLLEELDWLAEAGLAVGEDAVRLLRLPPAG